MTLAMPDSTNVTDLPPGYSAYLGYVDGDWPTAAKLADKFPRAQRVLLTVTGSTLAADGIDCEPGNPNAHRAAVWAYDKLQQAPDSRPVIYASVIGQPGYGMPDVLRELEAVGALGVDRSEVRLLSAHYGKGPHICGPDTCREISIPMDGTQWTDRFLTPAGTVVDMSELNDSFFDLTWTEKLMQQLPTLQEGSTGAMVKRVQCLCNVTGFQGAALAVDGVFGFRTKGAVEIIQADHGLAQDGVVGPLTWPVLLGIA